MAKISEKERFAAKNYFLHNKRTLEFADKRKMPVDERKVKEMLRHQNEFRLNIEDQIPNFERVKRKTQYKYGLLLYLAESAAGEVKELLDEVYVRPDTLPFINYAEKKARESEIFITPGDSQFKYLMAALFTPLDMTDYEDSFCGFDEITGDHPFSNINWIQRWDSERTPQMDALPNINKRKEEGSWHPGTGTTMQGVMTDKYTEVDPEEYDIYTDDDDGGDEDYDEEEYGDEEDYGDYGDYGDYDEEVADPLKEGIEYAQKMEKYQPDDQRFFRVNDKLREKYSTSELDQFMKILDIRGKPQWQDDTISHYKLGTHSYEDENQEMDPEWHTLSEVEREEKDNILLKEWRSGTEVNFVLGGRIPIRPNYRF